MLGILQGVLEGLIGNKEKDLPRLYHLLHQNDEYRLTRVQQMLCRLGGGRWVLFLVLVLWVCLACVAAGSVGEMMGFSFWGYTGLGFGTYALGVFLSFKQGLFQRDWYTPSFKLKQHFYQLMGDFLVKNPQLVSSFAPSIHLLEEGRLSKKWLCETCVVMKKLGLCRNLDFGKRERANLMVEIVREQALDQTKENQVELEDKTWKI